MTEKPHDIGLDSKSSTQRDRIDLNHEISGEETGRIQRFLSAFTGAAQIDSEKKKSERRYNSMLHMLLMEDAGYAQLYYAVEDKVNQAYQAVGQALVDIKQRLLASEQRLEILRDQTAQLDDGTTVFLSSEGSIYTEGGQRLGEEVAQDITIPEGAPSWESYNAEKEKRDALLRDQKEIEAYKTDILENIDLRMKDEDNPLDKDELEDFQNKLDKANMPSSLKSFYNPDVSEKHPAASVSSEIDDPAQTDSPKITSAFDRARFDLIDIPATDPQKSPPATVPST